MTPLEFHSAERLRVVLWVGVAGAALAAAAGMFGFHDASVWRLPGALEQRVAASLDGAGVPGIDIDVDGQQVALRGVVASQAAIAAAERAALHAAGPGGEWSGGVTAVDASQLAVGPIEQPFIWRIVRGENQVTLSGAVPSEAARSELLRAATSAFPNAETIDQMRIVGGAPSSSWTAMARNVIRALATLTTGEARITDTGIALIGEGPFEAVERLRAAYSAPSPPFRGRVVATVDGLDLANPALQGLPLNGSLQSCAAAITRVTDAQPINFVSDSLAVTPQSQPGLSALADVALRCDGNIIEIYGPAQGGAQLSQQRAETVAAQLAREGVHRNHLRTAAGTGRRLDIQVRAETP